MITKDDLKKFDLDDEKSGQVMELLGTAAEKLYAENGYKKAKDEVDREILMLTKIAKKDDEKSSDYMKRATKEYSDKLIEDAKTDLNEQITGLEQKLKEKPGDEKLKQEIEDLKTEKAKIPELIAAKVKEVQDKLTQTESDYAKDKKVWNLKSAISGFKFKDDLDPEYREFKINAEINKALQDFDVFEETKDGLMMKNSTSYEQKLAKDYFATAYESIIDTGVNQLGGGAGTGNKPPKKPTNGELKFEDDENDNSKISKIRTYLATTKNLDPLSNEFDKEFNTLLKEHKLDQYMTIVEKKE